MDIKKFNGNRLREALLYRGETITDIANKTDIKKQSLSAYCKGDTNPPSENVWKISGALNFPFQYFFQEDGPVVSTEKSYFRSQAAATKRGKNIQTEKMKNVARLYDFLDTHYINFPFLDIPEIDFDAKGIMIEGGSINHMQDIEAVADQLRQYWKLGRGPIKNLQYTLEEHGILITGFPVSENDRIDAFSQKIMPSSGNELFVVALGINQKSLVRLRFDMCHELGHVLLHSWDATEDEQDDMSREDFNEIERQANMFAGAFLLPRETFLNDLGPYATDINQYKNLKNKWGVSMAAMMYRAWQIGAITANQYQYMMRQYSKKGYRTGEPGDTPGDINDTLFKGALELLFKNGILTPESFAEQLFQNNIGLGTSDLEELMHLEPGYLSPKTEDKDKVVDITLRIRNQ